MDGGNAVDAAVAVLFCIGLAHPQSAGIGGGFVMTVYDTASGQARCLNAREVAPAAATVDMYGANGTLSKTGSNYEFQSIRAGRFETKHSPTAEYKPIPH